MRVEVIVIFIVVIIYGVYRMYFRNYYCVRKCFLLLRRFLDARDSLVIKILPEVPSKELVSEVMKAIEERRLNFAFGHNHAILSDARLNMTLKKLYQALNEIDKNDLQKELFARILHLEQDLKNIRKEYTEVVEKYNCHLVKHPMVLMRILKMKPLDQYAS